MDLIRICTTIGIRLGVFSRLLPHDGLVSAIRREDPSVGNRGSGISPFCNDHQQMCGPGKGRGRLH